jgi:hypothetical protein
MPVFEAIQESPPSFDRYTPTRRDRYGQLLWIALVEQNGVQTESAAAGLPRWPMWVIPQPAHQLESLATVVRAEQRGRLDADIHDVGLIGPGWRDLPGLLDGRVDA